MPSRQRNPPVRCTSAYRGPASLRQLSGSSDLLRRRGWKRATEAPCAFSFTAGAATSWPLQDRGALREIGGGKKPGSRTSGILKSVLRLRPVFLQAPALAAAKESRSPIPGEILGE